MGIRKSREYASSGSATCARVDRGGAVEQQPRGHVAQLQQGQRPQAADGAAQQGANGFSLFTGGPGAHADDGEHGNHHQSGAVVDGGAEKAHRQSEDRSVEGPLKQSHRRYHQGRQHGHRAKGGKAVEHTAFKEENQQKGHCVADPFD